VLEKRARQLSTQIRHAAARSRLRRLIYVVRSYRGIILAFGFALAGIAAIAVNLIAPIWQVSATVLVPSGQLSLAALADSDIGGAESQDYLATQLEILASRQLAEKVIVKLGLLQQAEYQLAGAGNRSWLPGFLSTDDPLQTADPLQVATDNYIDRLGVKQVGGARTINVSVASSDPKLAVAIANAHTEAYLAYASRQSEADEMTAGFVLNWMSGRLGVLREQLAAADQQLQLARQRQERNIASQWSGDVDEATARLDAARRELATVKAVYMEVYQGRAEPRKDLDRVPTIAEDEFVLALSREVSDAKAYTTEMRKELGRDDLNTLQAEWDQIAASAAVNVQMLRVAERIRADYENAREYEAEITRGKQNINRANSSQLEFAILQQDFEVQRELYYLFAELINETAQATDANAMGAQIISPATVPGVPVAPRKFLIVFLTLLIGLLVGTLAMLILAARKSDGAVHSILDIQPNLGMPLLGAVPPMQAANIAFDQSATAWRDENNGISAIITGIARDCPCKASRIIYVTSTADGEGKSTVATNLAYAFAGKERVLLVDADMRKTVPPGLPVAPGCQGLTELLAGLVGLKDVIKHREQEGLDLMGAGLGVADPLPLLSSSRVDSMFKVLTQSYDRIIVDGPAVGVFDDSLLFARHANSIVFVTRCDDTPVIEVREVLERVRHAGIRITGLVLNQMDRRKVSKNLWADSELANIAAPAVVLKDQSLSQVTWQNESV
jgi:succinoglycan biosynthesis transport protein ExoP